MTPDETSLPGPSLLDCLDLEDRVNAFFGLQESLQGRISDRFSQHRWDTQRSAVVGPVGLE